MKRAPNIHEKVHLAILASLPCVVCGARPVEVHHIKEAADGTFIGAGRKSSHFDALPLCQRHHRLGGQGVAYHSGPKTWVANFGTQRSLLEALRAWFDDPCAPYPHTEAAA